MALVFSYEAQLRGPYESAQGFLIQQFQDWQANFQPLNPLLTLAYIPNATLTTDSGGNPQFVVPPPTPGTGTVTSIGVSVPAASILSVTGSPITTSGIISLVTSGTSGGVPYFSDGNTLSTSSALTAGAPVLGGGAGGAPTAASIGTFTPVLNFGGAVTGITYTTQTGRYLQLGKQVQVWIAIVLSSKGSATGAATLTGLPATSKNSTNDRAILAGLADTTGATSFTPNAYIAPNTTTLTLTKGIVSGTLTALADTDCTNTTSLWFTGAYEAN